MVCSRTDGATMVAPSQRPGSGSGAGCVTLDTLESGTELSRKRCLSDPFNDPAAEQLKRVSNTTSRSLKFIRNSNLSRVNSTFVESSDSHVTRVAADPPVSEPPKSSHDDDEVSLEVLEDMHRLEQCFPVLANDYRLLDKIGEGTFSTVYKAEALNGTVRLGLEKWALPPLKRSNGRKSLFRSKNPIVALKQIYVTSSPNRIHNELNLLYMLSGNDHIAPLLDVLRFQDQVVAVLPFYHHADFRDFYRDLPVKGMKKYMYELFHALDFVHSKGVIHRDLKPTNFLYDPFKGKGVLVDFGLAERAQSTGHSTKLQCPCSTPEKIVINRAHNKRLNVKAAYPKQDQRPPRRANRAGTRGFRAPEVLFKCTNQTTKIDMWLAGVIGLSLLARKFPLFNSPDDTDALVEIGLMFGVERLRKCAELHGCGLEICLDTVYSHNGNLVRILSDLLHFENKHECLPPMSTIQESLDVLPTSGDRLVRPSMHDDLFDKKIDLYNDHKYLIDLLHKCLLMDPGKRISAKQALEHDFFFEFSNRHADEILL